jgi:hydroxypyruvate isomerase
MPKIAANISMLFREFAMLDRFRAEAAAGFDGVEMQFPYAESPAELKQWLPLVRHVQFADAPDRHEPGTGGLRFEMALDI